MTIAPPTQQDRRILRNFGLLMGGVFAGVFGLLLPWWRDHPTSWWPWVLGAVFAVPALMWPAGLGPVYRLWMRFGHVLGWINTRIILAVVFYFLIAPIGVLYRLLAKDPMRRNLERDVSSYRISTPVNARDDMEKPF